MLEQLAFYFRHSLNDLLVNKRRTFFALLSIAAGVATIVSLQTLAVMIGDTLTGNLQENNRGDIQIQTSFDFTSSEDIMQQGIEDGFLVEETRSFFGQEMSRYYVGEGGIAQLQAWIDENYPGEIELTYRQPLTDMLGIFISGGDGTAVTDVETGEQMTSISPIVIDAAVYPFYSEIRTQDGALLADRLQAPTDIVVNEQIAQTLELEIGDELRLNGAEEAFTLRGVVATEMQIKDPTSSDVFGAMFGFYLLDHRSAALFDKVTPEAETIYFKLAGGDEHVVEINEALAERYPYLLTTTTEDLRETYDELSDNIGQLVSVMGLVSLLLGSIGIVNTMQVIVRRRTTEIAVLKTIGLQAGEVTTLFMVEAIIMGVVGSIAGVALGWITTFFIRGVAEKLLATDLPFVMAPNPAINGLVVGTLVTVIFGFLPTLSAGQVRPSIVLRPSDSIVPKAGRLRTVGALVLIVVALSLVAQSVLGSLTIAIQVTIGAFIAAGVLYLLLSLLIWLVGRFFPPLGSVDLKISLRQMLVGRSRAAITLLALVVGVFSLSLITLLAQSIGNMLEYTLDNSAGGNVLVSVIDEQQIQQVEDILAEIEGVNSYDVILSYNLDLLSMEEGDTGEIVSLEELGQRLEENLDTQIMALGGRRRGETELNHLEILKDDLGGIGAPTLDQLEEREFIEGRQLTADDAGEQVMIITESDWTNAVGINEGDKLTYAFSERGGLPGMGGGGGEAETITFEIVGVVKKPSITVSMGGMINEIYALVDSFPADQPPNGISIIVDIEDEQVPALRQALNSVPGTFALETAFINRLLNSMFSTFTAFPTMVAMLGLIVGGVVIANSVALTTMERRREIAVMKAVGLQRERVLAMILLENAILGLIGGLIGVGIGMVGLVILTATFQAPGSTLPFGAALLLMLLCVGVSLVAALTTAWGASGEKPLNVLRGE